MRYVGTIQRGPVRIHKTQWSDVVRDCTNFVHLANSVILVDARLFTLLLTKSTFDYACGSILRILDLFGIARSPISDQGNRTLLLAFPR